MNFLHERPRHPCTEITDRLDREKQKAYWNAQYDAMKKQGIVYKAWKE